MIIRFILGFYFGMFGKIFINGLEFINLFVKKKIGYIFEVIIFFKNLLVIEYFYLFVLMLGVDKKVIKDRINYIMDNYGFYVLDMFKSFVYMFLG